jgi:hypothetical protein
MFDDIPTKRPHCFLLIVGKKYFVLKNCESKFVAIVFRHVANSSQQKAQLDSFTAGGGVIIRAGKAEPGVAARAEDAARGPRLSLEPRGYVLGQLTRKPDGRTLILHLLNYDHQGTAENVKVRLQLNGLVDLQETKDLGQWQVKVLSPDTPQPQFTGLSLHGCTAEFVLDRIQHYTVVTFSPNPGP